MCINVQVVGKLIKNIFNLPYQYSLQKLNDFKFI